MATNGEPARPGPGQASHRAPADPLDRHLAIAQQLTHVGSWEWDVSTDCVHWSDELYRIYGLEPQSCDISLSTFLAKIHPEDRQRVQAAVRAALERGGRFAHTERIVRPDGSVRILDSIGEVLKDASGRPLRLIGTCRDVTEERKREEAFQLYVNIVRNVQIGLSVWRTDAAPAEDPTLVASNPATERIAGMSLETSVGRSMLSMFPELSRTELPDMLMRVGRDRRERELPKLRLTVGSEGQMRTFAAKAFPLPGSNVGLALEDVTEQTRWRQLQAAERRVLEMVASGAELDQILSTLIIAIEKHAPPTLGSIQLLDADGIHIRHLAAPHLPEAFNKAIDGEPIGPVAGSCGTAAFLARAVFAGDIATDPLWAQYKDLALSHGLRACWSTPIHSSEGRVLGTFALYYRQPRQPTRADLELITRATHVAGIAIQRKQLDDQLRALTARIEAAREDERTAMSQEIHDELGQALTALKMDVAWLQRRMQALDAVSIDSVWAKLQSMSLMIDGVIDEVRRISAELRPGVLDDLGLGAAVEWQAQDFSMRLDIPCDVDTNVQDMRFERNLSTGIFRILQEAMTNVARHAHATRVDISLREKDGVLRLEVTDDGVGITSNAAERAGSLGLLGIKERARRLGGAATISSKAGGGTQVAVEVPLSSGRVS